MNEQTKTLVANWYLAQVSAKDFSDWAISCIEHGIESKNILILASIINPQSFYEVEDYFRRSLRDLDWEFPNQENSLFEYAKRIAKQILDQEIEPLFGVAILSRIYDELDRPRGLSNWNYLNWMQDELTEEQMKSAVIFEAQKLVNFAGTLTQLIEKELSISYFEELGVMKTAKENLFSKLWRKIF